VKLGIMQPYFFPYLGYYQLARSVDHFVFLDDVSFRRGGFINRNRIMLDGQPFLFSLPVKDASSFRVINQHCFTGDTRKFLAQLRHAYADARCFEQAYALVEAVACDREQNVAHKCARSVTAVFDYLGLPLSHSASSQAHISGLHGEDRVLGLCAHHGATDYHNASGGRALYDADRFSQRGIALRFLRNSFPAYSQGYGPEFVPGLSIIDVLMHASPAQARQMFDAYALEAPGTTSGTGTPA